VDQAGTVVKDTGGWVVEQWDVDSEHVVAMAGWFHDQRRLPMMRCLVAGFQRETVMAGVDTKSPRCSRWTRGSRRMAGAAQRWEALVVEEAACGKAPGQVRAAASLAWGANYRQQ
jgi:hypothetical protein